MCACVCVGGTKTEKVFVTLVALKVCLAKYWCFTLFVRDRFLWVVLSVLELAL